MGMLMHHTWLKQQEQAAEKPVVKEPEKPVKAEEPKQEAATPKKVTGGRRKVSK